MSRALLKGIHSAPQAFTCRIHTQNALSPEGVSVQGCVHPNKRGKQGVLWRAGLCPQAQQGWSTAMNLLYCLATNSSGLAPMSSTEKPGQCAGTSAQQRQCRVTKLNECSIECSSAMRSSCHCSRRQTGTPTCSKTSRPLPIGPSPAPFAGRPLLLGPSTPSPASEIIAGRLAKTPPRANSCSTLPGECLRLSWSSAAHGARASGGGAGTALPPKRSAGGPGPVHSTRVFRANRCCLCLAHCRTHVIAYNLRSPAAPTQRVKEQML